MAWSAEGIDVLREYLEDGGLLVILNSGHRLKHRYPPLDENEDWSDVNALSQVFGVSFYDGATWSELGRPADHALMDGLEVVSLAESNGLPFTFEGGEALAFASNDPVMALVPFGNAGGEVVVMGDIGILRTNAGTDPRRNLPFWLNLAQYALQR